MPTSRLSRPVGCSSSSSPFCTQVPRQDWAHPRLQGGPCTHTAGTLPAAGAPRRTNTLAWNKSPAGTRVSACRHHRWPGLLPGPPLAQQPWAPFPGRRQAAHGETLDGLCHSRWTPPRVTRKQATPTKLHVGTPECKFPLVPQLTKHPARDFLCNHVKMWKPSSARGLRGHLAAGHVAPGAAASPRGRRSRGFHGVRERILVTGDAVYRAGRDTDQPLVLSPGSSCEPKTALETSLLIF